MTKKMMFTLITLLMFVTSFSFAQVGVNNSKAPRKFDFRNNVPNTLFGGGTNGGSYGSLPGLSGAAGSGVGYANKINTFKKFEDEAYSFRCLQKRQNEACGDGINRIDAILPLEKTSWTIYDTSPAACFSKKSDECDLSPDIRRICGCLAVQNGSTRTANKTHADKTDDENNFINIDNSTITSAAMGEAVTQVKMLRLKLAQAGCLDKDKELKPDVKDKCMEIERKIQVASRQAFTSRNLNYGAAGGAGSTVGHEIAEGGGHVAGGGGTTGGNSGSNERAPASVDVKHEGIEVPVIIAPFQNNCMDFHDFNKDYEVPSETARAFFDAPNTSDEQSRARAIVIMSLMKGEAIYDSSVDDTTVNQYLDANKLSKKPEDKNKILAEIKTMLRSDSWRFAKEDLKTFASNNKYWAGLLAKDPKRAIDDFQGIYHRREPREMVESIRKLNSREDVILAKEEAAKKNAELIDRIYNKENGLMKKNSFRLYSDFDLVNMKVENEGAEKYSPMFCAMTSRMLDTRRTSNDDNNYSSSSYKAYFNADLNSINEKTIEGCKSTYADICGHIGTTDEFNNSPKLAQDEKDDLRAGIDFIVGKKRAMDNRVNSYLEFQRKVCSPLSKHKMKSSYGFGDAEISRDEFKKELCEKKNRKLVKAIPEGVTLDKACEDSSEGATYLTSMYTNGLDPKAEVGLDARVTANKATNADSRKEKEEDKQIVTYIASNDGSSENYSDEKDCGFICSLTKSEAKIANAAKTAAAATGTPAPSTSGSGPSFGEQLASSFSKAAESITQPAIDNNVQSYLNGNIPASSILPASFANADAAQISGAKSSVDNSIAQLEKKIDNYEKSNSKASASSQNEELELLRKQIAELKQQSESLKSQLEKEKENKVAAKSEDQNAVSSNVSRSVASSDYKGINPQVSGATQATMNQNSNPSKVYENMFADGSFHSVPTIGSSKSIDSKAFTSRSSNDALLSIYTDKGVSSLVDAVATTSNSNILVVGNALEMQETTVKDKKFQTKELVVDQGRLDMIRSNPDSLRSLIEENKIKNHVGILTLKNGENQLNYIMRKDDSGKVVILPLNIARKVTLDSLKNELIRN